MKEGKTLETVISRIKNIHDDEIKKASEYIKNGGVIAYPTETVYGLGADALNKEAVEKIFIAKGRSHSKALTVIVGSKNINDYVKEVPEVAEKLIDKFWPGPLTIILKKKDIIPDITSGNLDSIGIRMTSNEIALKLIEHSNTLITSTSANISGKPSHRNIEECTKDLYGKVDCIIGDDKEYKGVESTIIDCTRVPAKVLRKGAITIEMLKSVDERIEL